MTKDEINAAGKTLDRARDLLHHMISETRWHLDHVPMPRQLRDDLEKTLSDADRAIDVVTEKERRRLLDALQKLLG